MNDIALTVLVILATGLLVAAIFYISHRRSAATESALQQVAADNGWKYEPIRAPRTYGYRMHAADWTLESISQSSGSGASEGSTTTIQRSTWIANLPGSTVLIGPRLSQTNLGAMGEMLLQQVLDRYLGSDGRGVNEVQSGSEPFRKRFMVYAQDPRALPISAPLEEILINWIGPLPHIKRTSRGLEIETAKLLKPGEIQQITALGHMLQSQISGDGTTETAT
jgi:hypothetical protein